MKKLVGGNWKMNCSLETFKGLRELDALALDELDLFLAIPYAYLPFCRKFFPQNISICAQDVSEFESGAYTGEVSAAMLAEVGVQRVLIGHSERRMNCNETPEQISHKLANTLKYGMQPILCVGEPLEIRESNRHLEFLENQFNTCLGMLAEVEIDVAYEPVWAIGASKAASEEQISEVILKIKDWMKHRKIKGRVIYGGSVCMKNSDAVAKIRHLDGVLVGNASLGREFEGIARKFATKRA